MNTNQITAFKETAKKVLQRDGNHAPVVILEHRSQELEPMVLNFTTDEEKKQCVNVLKKRIEIGDIKSYLMITENFYTSNKDDLPEKRPSEDTDGKECLLIAYKDELGTKKAYLIEFKRNNKTIEFEPEVELDNFMGEFDFWK